MEVKRSFFAEQLRKIMFEKKLTQQKLADMTGINRPLISRWIIGDRNPSLTSLKKIANVLDVSVEYFIENGKENKNNFDEKDIEILKLKNEILDLKNKNLELEKENLELKYKKRRILSDKILEADMKI